MDNRYFTGRYAEEICDCLWPVSYTHLDVYKRQSQNGAQEMAREGKNYEEILMFFYDGVEIRDCEED